MPSPRLQQQFIRLWQSCHGEATDTTLEVLSGVMNCSRRHMRSLLSTMQDQGWLHWQAQVGRGKRSTLTFLYTGLALQQQRAEEFLEQDQIEQLVQLVGDKTQVRQMLLSQLGRSFRQGKHLLRVLYYRPLFNLLPGTMLRRSETHIARQIFSGLTLINEEKGEVEGDLAHHWQQVTPLHWRFYLRPAIHFHHGRELEMADIITTFTRLKQSHRLFSHLASVTSPTSNVIDIHLLTSDRWLPWLLGNIHAFDDYFGFRALIDEVTIWVLPELTEDLVHSGVQLQADESGKSELESRLEEGCYFLLFDQRSPVGQHDETRQWLCDLLSPIALLNAAEPIYQRYWSPAYGLLPRWHHKNPQPGPPKPEGLTHITLTFYSEHSEHQAICNALRPLLLAEGIELIIQVVEYAVWHRGDAQSDLWLGIANFTLPLEFSLFATFLELPLATHCFRHNMDDDAALWHAGEFSMAEWSQKQIANHQIHPLFHHWLVLQGQRSMRGVRMNTLGWFDFKSAWFAPPDS